MKNNKILSILMAFIILLGVTPQTVPGVHAAGDRDDKQQPEAMEHEMIVKYRASEIALFSNETEAEMIREIDPAVNDVAVLDEVIMEDQSKTKLLKVDSAKFDSIINELNQRPEIEYAEPNYKIYAAEQDPDFTKQWGLYNTGQTVEGTEGTAGIDIDVLPAWNHTKGDESVIVAVVDSGVDIHHPDLTSSIYKNKQERANGQDTDGNGYIDDINGWDFTTYSDSVHNGDNTVFDSAQADEHGTHIAGIIAAAHNSAGIQGVAPNVKILPVKVMSDREGTVFAAIKGIEYAEMMGAQIVNCSWTVGAYVRSLEDCIKNSDMLFVCAAGNDGNDLMVYPEYPAAWSYDNIITVGAVNNKGQLCSFSNYGNNVDIVAPGEAIYSTVPEGEYQYSDGTSMAAPFVAGSAALIKSADRELLNGEIKELLIQESGTYTDYAGNTKKGMLNAAGLFRNRIEETKLSNPSYGTKYVTENNNIYAIGGYGEAGYLDTLQKYDIDLQQWEQVTLIPEGLAEMQAVFYDGKVYLFGGIGEQISNSAHIYDFNTGVWTEGEKLPEGVYGASSVLLDGKFYLFGGITSQGYCDRVYTYDFLTNTWSIKNTLPEPLAYTGAAAINGKVYIAGGVNADGCKTGIYEYDPQTDGYTRVQNLSTPRKDSAVAVYDDKIHIIGGSSEYYEDAADNFLPNRRGPIFTETVCYSTEIFDPAGYVISNGGTTEGFISGMESIQYQDHVYLAGGWSGTVSGKVIRYFGTERPRYIRIKSQGDSLRLSWRGLPGASQYEIEINNKIYTTNELFYDAPVAEGTDYKIRLRAKGDGAASLWSDYRYHTMYASMADAKLIELNSVTQDRLYANAHVKWYQLNTGTPGVIKLTLSNVLSDSGYTMQLCNSAGMPVALSEEQNGSQVIDNFAVSQYNYYIRVFSSFRIDESAEYTLTSELEQTNADDLPDQIKAAVVQPSWFNDDSGQVTPHSVEDLDNENADVPEVAEREAAHQQAAMRSDGKSGENEPLWEPAVQDFDFENQAAPLSSQDEVIYYTSEDTISAINGVKTYTAEVPAGSIPSSKRGKLVVEVIPENENDRLLVQWTGDNTNYTNFISRYLYYDKKPHQYYYLTASLSGSTAARYYGYRVKLEQKGQSSSGNFTIRVYLIVGNTSQEDFGGYSNDVPKYAKTVSVNKNSNTPAEYVGTIDHALDTDIYKIQLNKGDKLTAVIQSPKSTVYSVSIYNNPCTGDSWEPSQFVDGWIRESDGQGDASFIAPNNGVYAIMVRSFNGTYSAEKPYTLEFYCNTQEFYGDLEVNNEFKNADKITEQFSQYVGGPEKPATPVSFSIDSPADVDRYPIYLNKGDKLSILMQMPQNYYDDLMQYRIEVHDLEGEYYIRHSYNNPGSKYSKYATFIAEESKIYYVAVASVKERPAFDYKISGKLTVTRTPQAKLDNYEIQERNFVGITFVENNDFIYSNIIELGGGTYGFDTAQIFPQGGQLSANLDNELDVDWYRVKFGSGTAVNTVRLTQSGGSACNIVVMDSSYKMLTSGKNNVTYEFQPNMTYYIAVTWGGDSFNGVVPYTVKLEENAPTQDLIFHPVTWGTFIYDNAPEYLVQEDLADAQFGNRCLMNAYGITGIVDIATSHLLRNESIVIGEKEERTVSLDYLFHNPSQTDTVTIKVLGIGVQTTFYGPTTTDDDDMMYKDFSSFRGWLDHQRISLIEEEKFVGNYMVRYDENGEPIYNYQSYIDNTQPQYGDLRERIGDNGVITLAPGETKWFMDENRFEFNVSKGGYPYFMVTRIEIEGGPVDYRSVAFHDVNAVNIDNLYDAPLITSSTDREDSGEDWQIDHKCKGVAASVAETKAEVSWDIQDDYRVFKPTIYNGKYPEGKQITQNQNPYIIYKKDGEGTLTPPGLYTWMTHINPANDIWSMETGVRSDMLSFIFIDDTGKEWYFDPYHERPAEGNNLITTADGYSPKSISMGNYTVTEQYTFHITNTTNMTQTVSYIFGSPSSIFYTYIVDGIITHNIKTETNMQDSDGRYIYHELFDFTINSGETKDIVVEIVMPNIGTGGLNHMLYAHTD